MKKIKILLTGVKGVMGRIIYEELKNDFEFVCIDIGDGNFGQYYDVDISDYKRLEEVFSEHPDINTVLHFAADSNLEAGWDSVLKNNIIATRNIYECTKNKSLSKVIFASSSHVTGAYEGNPRVLHLKDTPQTISSNMEIRPDSDYAVSKAFGESLARKYWELYKLKSICLRIGNVLSDNNPTKDLRAMKIWLSHNDLIQLIIKSIETKVFFAIYYGVSANKGKFWDISNANKEIGYHPKDDSSLLNKKTN